MLENVLLCTIIMSPKYLSFCSWPPCSQVAEVFPPIWVIEGAHVTQHCAHAQNFSMGYGEKTRTLKAGISVFQIFCFRIQLVLPQGFATTANIGTLSPLSNDRHLFHSQLWFSKNQAALIKREMLGQNPARRFLIWICSLCMLAAMLHLKGKDLWLDPATFLWEGGLNAAAEGTNLYGRSGAQGEMLTLPLCHFLS